MIILLFLLIPPLKPPLLVTSGFGSYRYGHFHAGIDFSTGGKIGKPIYAVSGGKIIRIRASYTGYGKAIYLELKNGDVLVYAHLSRFSRSLERKVRYYQKRRKKYRIDISLDPPYKVHEGEIIGFSGASGAGPPHLHFEWRTKKGYSINPLPRLGIAESLQLNVKEIVFSSRGDAPWEIEVNPESSDTLIVHSPFRVWARINDRSKDGHVRSGLPEKLLVTLDKDSVFLLNFSYIDPRGLLGEALYSKRYSAPLLSLFRPKYLIWNQVRGLTQINPKGGLHKLEIELFGAENKKISIPIYVVDTVARKPEILRWDWNYRNTYFRFFREGLLIKGVNVIVTCGKVPIESIFKEGDTLFYWLMGMGKWRVKTASSDSLSLRSFWVRDSLHAPFGDDTDKNSWLRLTKKGIAEPFLLWKAILPEGKGTKELEPVSPRIIYFPSDPMLKSPIKISLSKPPDRRVGLFQRKSWGWWFLGRENCSVWELSEFGLFRDTIPPTLRVRKLTKRGLYLKLWDMGAGVDIDKIDAYLDGKWIPIDYDPDDGALTYIPLRKLERKTHVLFISAKDRLGNKTTFKKRFYTR